MLPEGKRELGQKTVACAATLSNPPLPETAPTTGVFEGDGGFGGLAPPLQMGEVLFTSLPPKAEVRANYEVICVCADYICILDSSNIYS
jgi:hypothetical protein